MLAKEPVKSRVGQLAIGLAADCDAPADAIQQLFYDNLDDPGMLPFVGVLTYDGQWVGGYSGHKEAAEFSAFLEQVAKSPLLEATPAVREQLAKHEAEAKAAAASGKWGEVVKIVREADSCFGRCPERDAVNAVEKQARDWVESKFAAVTAAGVNGDKLVAARKLLAEVKRAFVGQPEADLADIGIKAIQSLNRVRSIEARGNPKKDLRANAAAEFKGTRWVEMFDKPASKG